MSGYFGIFRFRLNKWKFQATGHYLNHDGYSRCHQKVMQDFAFVNIGLSDWSVPVYQLEPRTSTLKEVTIVGKAGL